MTVVEIFRLQRKARVQVHQREVGVRPDLQAALAMQIEASGHVAGDEIHYPLQWQPRP